MEIYTQSPDAKIFRFAHTDNNQNKLKLQINSYKCVKWHSHKQNDRHKCVRRIYFCTLLQIRCTTSSRRLQTLRSDSTTSNPSALTFAATFAIFLLQNWLAHLCMQTRESRRGWGGWSPFIGRCLTNEQRQPVRLAMLEINICIHIYKLFLQPLDNIFIKNMTFVSVVLFMWMPFYTFVTINLHLQLRNTGVLIIVCVCKSKDSAFRIRTLRVNLHLQIQIWMLQVLEFCYWSTCIIVQQSVMDY